MKIGQYLTKLKRTKQILSVFWAATKEASSHLVHIFNMAARFYVQFSDVAAPRLTGVFTSRRLPVEDRRRGSRRRSISTSGRRVHRPIRQRVRRRPRQSSSPDVRPLRQTHRRRAARHVLAGRRARRQAD